MKNLIKAAGVAVMVLAPMQANTAKTGNTGSVPFNGQVNTTCTITVGNAGTLAASADFLTLASTEAGGAAGTANIVTNGNTFALSSGTPALAGPTTEDSASSSMTSTGGSTTFTGVTSSALNRGATQVNVDMTAAAAGGFSSGVYSATVLLTCE